jgi:hypothetical protein
MVAIDIGQFCKWSQVLATLACSQLWRSSTLVLGYPCTGIMYTPDAALSYAHRLQQQAVETVCFIVFFTNGCCDLADVLGCIMHHVV